MMIKVELTEEQYRLIRASLENYYYVCKDDSELYHKLDEIGALETLLIRRGC